MTSRSISSSSAPQTIQTVQVSATESAAPAPGSAKPANMTVRIAPNQNAEANCGYIEWNGKKYQIFVKNKKGQLLSTENRNWSSIVQNHTKFLQAQKDVLPDGFKAAKWNLQTGDADYETHSDIPDKKDAQSAANVNVNRTSDRIRHAAMASFTHMRDSVRQAHMRLSTKPLPAPTPSLVTPARATVVSPSRTLSGTYCQSNYQDGTVRAGQGNSSCAVNTGRALIRMLSPNGLSSKQAIDDILREGITEYQRQIPIYRSSGVAQPADKANNPHLETGFVATTDPEWQRHLDLVPVGDRNDYMRPHVGDLRAEGEKGCFNRMLTILEDSCPNGQTRGAALLIKDGTYAVKVTKDALGKATYQLFDSHGGGSKNAACLMDFSSKDHFVSFLAQKYKAEPNGRTEDNQVGMTIVRLKGQPVASQPLAPPLRSSSNATPPRPPAVSRPLPPHLPSKASLLPPPHLAAASESRAAPIPREQQITINGAVLDIATLFPHILKSNAPIKDFNNQVISPTDLEKIYQKAAEVFHVDIADLRGTFASQPKERNNQIHWLVARSDDCPDKLKSALSAALPLVAV